VKDAIVGAAMKTTNGAYSAVLSTFRAYDQQQPQQHYQYTDQTGIYTLYVSTDICSFLHEVQYIIVIIFLCVTVLFCVIIFFILLSCNCVFLLYAAHLYIFMLHVFCQVINFSASEASV